MHSVSDLTTFCRKTTGDVPPKLVGASTTVVGSKMYLFGGRLVTERRMVSDLFVFDLETLNWERINTPPDDDLPGPRYFHSADTWNNYLIIFGGMGVKPDAENADDLCVLNDVRFYDLSTRRWMPSSWSHPFDNPSIPMPKARYAHLSSVSGDRLFIIGGQDLSNVWLDDVYVYDLHNRAWVQRRDYPRHCGTYRSVAVAASLRVRLPQEELKNSNAGPSKPFFRADAGSSSPSAMTSSASLSHLPYSAPATDEFPNDIYLYSNYNFTDVKRELEVFRPLPGNDFEISDQSTSMSGTAFPPGLRFPTGAILGTHLIIAGTYLAHSFQSFSVWALDLINMTWSRVDPGSTLSSGSWFRSCLWADANKFLIFGNRNGNLVDDYNRRLLSWDHVAVIDLEAFGIYQPPRLELGIRMQEMGLAALEEGVLADFEIICDDDRRVPCSRKVLEDRWPWFKEQRKRFLQSAARALDTLPLSSSNIPLPEAPGQVDSEPRPDPRLTPRALLLTEPYPITLALVQYFYSLALITPLQHAPAVLSALLVLSTNYELPHLQSLVKHAMHRALSNSTSVGVYEVATLCSCRSLQIRALKTVMLYNQKRPARTRQGKDGGSGSGGRTPDQGAGSGSGGGGGAGKPSEPPATARPRGMSDAWMRPSGAADGKSHAHVHATRGFAGTDDQLWPGQSGPGPSPMLTSPSLLKPERSWGALSTNTDFETSAVAELHSPTVVNAQSLLAVQEKDSIPLDDDCNTGRLQVADQTSKRTEHGQALQAHVQNDPMPSPRTLPTSYGWSSDSELDHFDDRSRPIDSSFSGPSYPSIRLTQPLNTNSHRDCDTPSLTSSTSRSSLCSSTPSRHSIQYNSPPLTPLLTTLPHAMEPYVASPLASISELPPGDRNRLRLSTSSMESKTAISFAPPSPESPLRYAGATGGADDGITEVSREPSWLQNAPNLENLRHRAKSPVETISAPRVRPPATAVAAPTPTPPSPDRGRESRAQKTMSVVSSGSSSSSVSRFFGAKSDKSDSPSKKKLTRTSTTLSDTSGSGSIAGGKLSKADEKQAKAAEKQRKAEEKQRKKEEARMRTLRLAEELKKRSEQRAIAREMESVFTVKSDEKKKKSAPWEEDSTMYGGMSGLTL